MEKIWLKNYPEGVPAEINPDEFASIIDVFEQSARKFAAKPAFSCMGKTITYAELDELTRRFAAFLQSRGLKPGDRIAIQSPNILQYPVCMFGALRAGLVVVNTNPLYTPREMQHQFHDSGAKAIVILENFASHLEEIIAQTQIQTVITTGIGDLLGGLKGFVVNFVVKYVKRMVPPYNLPGHIKLKDALAQGAKMQCQRPPVKGDDLAFVQYTGGTTGVSKGAMLTHRNIIANMQQMSVWLRPDENEHQIVITPLPLYHVYALTVSAMIFMHFGGQNVLIPNPRDMKAFLGELKKWKFTAISGINTLFNGMMNHPMFKEVDWTHAKIVTAGGMALQRAVADRFQQLTGIKIVEGYGLSETSPVTHMNPVFGGENRIGTIGMPAPSTDVKLLDQDTGEQITEPGKPGEIAIRGPQVMKGYWNRPDETAKSMTADGFFRTGDIGVMDEDGYFKIVDRIKDMINVSGLKVFPNEVEDVIASHPGVLEVAAVAVPDDKTGEAVKVFVVRRDPNLTPEEIKEFAKERLVNYKRPHFVEFRNELPKSNVGKILRRPLRDEAAHQAAEAAKQPA